MAEPKAFFEAYLSDKCFFELEGEKSHRKTSRVNREDGAKPETFHIPQIISISRIYVLGRCPEITIFTKFQISVYSLRNISKLSSAHIFCRRAR